MRKLADMLGKTFARTEVLKGVKGKEVLREWDTIVGPQLASRSVPDRFEKGVLWVAVEGSAWAQEMRMAKDTILQKLNAAAGEKIFLDIRFGNRRPKNRLNAPEPYEIDLGH